MFLIIKYTINRNHSNKQTNNVFSIAYSNKQKQWRNYKIGQLRQILIEKI